MREPEHVLDPAETPEAVSVIDNAPAPAVFPPAPDLNAQVARLIEVQTADIERRQREDVAQRQQAAQSAAPKPLMDQPEWREAYRADIAASSYDDAAAERVIQRQSQLADERASTLMDQRLQQFEQRTNTQMLAQSAPQLISSAAALASQENPLVTGALFTEAANTVFAGNPGLLAQALNDPTQGPETRKMLGIYAAGLAATRGEVGQDKRPAPPVSARPTAQTPGAAPAIDGMWGDTGYVNGVLMDAWTNPYGSKK